MKEAVIIEQAPPAEPEANHEAGRRTWHLDRPGGIPAPVIRANMISLRISYQGRVQVAFFERE